MRPEGKRPIGGYLAIEGQMFSEVGAALRRVSGDLEDMLAGLAKIEAEVAALDPADIETRRLRLEAHAKLRATAEKQRWCLIVQREACGATDHTVIERLFPIPPPLR